MKTTIILFALCLSNFASAESSDWQRLLESQEKIKTASLTWAFTWHVNAKAPRTDEQIAKLKEQFRQQDIANGMKGPELETAVNSAVSGFIESAQEKTVDGFKVCTFDGDVVQIAMFTGAKNWDSKALDKHKANVVEYWNGVDNTRFFSNKAQAGEIERRTGNPFGYTGATIYDVSALALYPLSHAFDQSDLKSVSGNVVSLEAPVPYHDNYVFGCKVDLKTGVPLECIYEEKSVTRIHHRCTVKSTQKVDGLTVPSEVITESFNKDGSIGETAVYSLVSAKLNASTAVEDLASMGHAGPVVIDYRLGKGKEQQYKYPGHLPSIEEATKNGVALGKPNESPIANTSAYAISAALISIGALIIALRKKPK